VFFPFSCFSFPPTDSRLFHLTNSEHRKAHNVLAGLVRDNSSYFDVSRFESFTSVTVVTRSYICVLRPVVCDDDYSGVQYCLQLWLSFCGKF
jgi:hypothetical protein